MSKITRPSKNIVAFGSNSVGTERTTFGTTTQANDLDSNLNDSFARGWGVVAGSDLPTKQDFNAMGYTLGQLNAYLYQMGIAEYDAAQEYHQNSFTNYNGVIYKSLTDNNIGNTPNTSTVNWESVIDGKYLPLSGGTLSGSLLIDAGKTLSLLDINKKPNFTIFNNGTSKNVSLSFNDTDADIYYTAASKALNLRNFSSVTINNNPVFTKSGGTVSGDSNFTGKLQKSGADVITTANVGDYQNGIGFNQTWQDVSASRVIETTYTNSTTKPIMVSIVVSAAASDYKQCSLLVDDVVAAGMVTSNYGTIGNTRGITLSTIVPSGSSYKLTADSFVPLIYNWSELK